MTKEKEQQPNALSKALASIKKSQPEAIFDQSEPLGYVSTGSIAADAVTTKGGLPRGRVTEISGWEASGKTTLVLNAMATAVRNGQTVAFLDMERALDLDFAAKIGLKFDDKRAFYFQPETFESATQVMETLIKTGDVDLAALDSVAAMIPKRVMEEDLMHTESIALRARLLHQWIPRLVATARRGTTAVVLINQLREVIPANAYLARFGPKTRTSGGSAVRFWPSLRLTMALMKKGNKARKAFNPFKEGDEDYEVSVANEHKVESEKNKVGAAYREAPLWIRYDAKLDYWGVDNVWTLMDMAVARELIVKKSGGYFIVDGTQIHGEDAVHELLFRNPAMCEGLAHTLLLDWSLYAPAHVPPAPTAKAKAA